MVIAGMAMVLGGVLMIVLGAMGRAGRLTRQSLVGLRTAATMVSDETWKVAHEAGASWVIGAGGVLLVGGFAVMVSASETVGGIVALVAVAFMLIPLTIGFQRGQAAARSV